MAEPAHQKQRLRWTSFVSQHDSCSTKTECMRCTPTSYSVNQAIRIIKPYSTCNPTSGASVGRGPFAFKPGIRMTVTEHVHLNYVGQQCLVMDRGCRCPPILPWPNGEKGTFRCKLSSVVCKLFRKQLLFPSRMFSTGHSAELTSQRTKTHSFSASQLPSRDTLDKTTDIAHTETNHSLTAITTFTHPHSLPNPQYAIRLFAIIGFLQRFTLTSFCASYSMRSAMSALLPMTHTPTHRLCKPLLCASFIGNMRTICDFANLSSHL